MSTATASAVPTFDCSKCRKIYPWRSEDVNRVARCSCGHVLRVPAFPDNGIPPIPAEPPPLPPPPATATAPPLPDIPMAKAVAARTTGAVPFADMAGPGPSFSANNPFMHREADAERLDPETEAELAATGAYADNEDPYTPNPTKDLHVPVALLAAGLVLIIGQILYQTQGAHAIAFPAACIGVIFGLVVNVALMLAGVVLAAKVAGINYGPVNTALLKICATYIAPTVLGEIVTAALGGDMAVAMIGHGVSIILYWALLSYLFRLDGQQTMITVVTITAVRILAAACIVGALMGLIFGVGGADFGM